MPQAKRKPRPILVITYEAGNAISMMSAKQTALMLKEAGYDGFTAIMGDDHSIIEVQGDTDISGIAVATLDQEAVAAIREANGERTHGSIPSAFRCGCCNVKRRSSEYSGGGWIKKDGKLERHIKVCKVCSVTAMRT